MILSSSVCATFIDAEHANPVRTRRVIPDVLGSILFAHARPDADCLFLSHRLAL
jgi:hypothetical protein